MMLSSSRAMPRNCCCPAAKCRGVGSSASSCAVDRSLDDDVVCEQVGIGRCAVLDSVGHLRAESASMSCVGFGVVERVRRTGRGSVGLFFHRTRSSSSRTTRSVGSSRPGEDGRGDDVVGPAQKGGRARRGGAGRRGHRRRRGSRGGLVLLRPVKARAWARGPLFLTGARWSASRSRALPARPGGASCSGVRSARSGRAHLCWGSSQTVVAGGGQGVAVVYDGDGRDRPNAFGDGQERARAAVGRRTRRGAGRGPGRGPARAARRLVLHQGERQGSARAGCLTRGSPRRSAARRLPAVVGRRETGSCPAARAWSAHRR